MQSSVAVKVSLSPDVWSKIDRIGRPQVRRRLLATMARRFRQSTLENFGPVGTDRPSPWERLSERYTRRKLGIRGRAPATLIKSGTLMRSIVWVASSEKAIVNANRPYAAVHQFGGGRRRMPRRPYFPVTEQGEVTYYTRTRLLQDVSVELEKIINRP